MSDSRDLGFQYRGGDHDWSPVCWWCMCEIGRAPHYAYILRGDRGWNFCIACHDAYTGALECARELRCDAQ